MSFFHCLFLPFLSSYTDCFYWAIWNKHIHLVCMIRVPSLLLPSHPGDHLLQICWWFYVSFCSDDCTVCFGQPNSATSTIEVPVPCPIILCSQGLPFSLCTSTVDPVGRNGIFLWVSVSWLPWGCLCKSTIRLLYYITPVVYWNFGSVLLAGLLNRSIARLFILGLINVLLFVHCLDGCKIMMQHDVCWVPCWGFKLLWYKVSACVSHYFPGQPVLR